MKTTPVAPADLAHSVIAVPPLARTAELRLDADQNRRLIRHLEEGGVTTLLYGGNANLYNIGLSEFTELLEVLPGWASEETRIIPSIGPAYGNLLDQASLVRDHGYPTAMALPLGSTATQSGVATGLRHAAERMAGPLIIYLKEEGYLDVELVGELVDDGLVCGIKYAIVRDDPSHDPFLEALVERVDPAIIISGIGEPPAIAHVLDFGLVGFTSGSVCLAPRLSTAMLRALRAGAREEAEAIREKFLPIEDLRNEVSPIRVLHDAVTSSGVADMGSILPMLSNLSEQERSRLTHIVTRLMQAERSLT